MSSVLVGVFTGNESKYRARRKIAEETWVRGLRDLNIWTVFVESVPTMANGSGFAVLKNDDYSMTVIAPDGWDYLPQKSRAYCATALGLEGWEYLVKLDDDSCVHPGRFAKMVESLGGIDYMGADVGTCQGFRPYASGGAGWILSKRAVSIVAEKLTDKTGYEDKRIGEILADAGIPLTTNPRFSPWASWGWPQATNDLITGHAIAPEVWLSAWEEIRKGR